MAEWKPVDGYNGKYEISSNGTLREKIPGGYQKVSSFKNRRGYPTAILMDDDGKRKVHYLHKLVATHFVPNPDKLPTINHKDGNKANNSKDNLQWCTQEDNWKHAEKLGLTD